MLIIFRFLSYRKTYRIEKAYWHAKSNWWKLKKTVKKLNINPEIIWTLKIVLIIIILICKIIHSLKDGVE